MMKSKVTFAYVCGRLTGALIVVIIYSQFLEVPGVDLAVPMGMSLEAALMACVWAFPAGRRQGIRL